MSGGGKRSLRLLACELRDALPAEARAAAAEAVARRLASLPELAAARTVLGYAATASEIDPAAALAHLRSLGTRVAYPRVEGAGALSLRVADPRDLAPGAYGIPEPPPGAEKVPPAEVDAVIVPGIAFDTACSRLGHGAGYYDRLLAGLRSSTTLIGVAFDAQVLDRIPVEAHDVPMDVLVTPSLVIRRG